MLDMAVPSSFRNIGHHWGERILAKFGNSGFSEHFSMQIAPSLKQ